LTFSYQILKNEDAYNIRLFQSDLIYHFRAYFLPQDFHLLKVMEQSGLESAAGLSQRYTNLADIMLISTIP
jgi:hypothetical protein